MAKFTFKSDTAELKKWLGKRKTTLENKRTHAEAVWRDLRLYYEPSLGKALLDGDRDAIAAKRDDEKILNTTPRTLLHRMAAGLQSGITNQSRQWFRLKTIDQRMSEMSAVRSWLDRTTETVSSMMNRSNCYTALDRVYLHLGYCGTSCAVVVSDEEYGMHVEVCDEGSYWIAEDRRGRVTVLLRRLDMTLDQLVEEFGEGWLPEELVRQRKEGQKEERAVVWNYIGPHNPMVRDIDSSRKFDSIYWVDSRSPDNNDGIVAIRSFGYNPIAGPRWSVTDSPYGLGCGQIGLGDAKELQQLEADLLRIVELEVDPAMLAPASMKNEALDTGAGGITYYPDILAARGNVIGRLFETNQQIQAVLLAIEKVETRLRQTFYADLFAMLIQMNVSQPKQMTAREVNELSGEKVALLGPILTRLNHDLLNPLIDACFAIAVERGMIEEAPPALQGQDLKVEYVSSLHIEQAASSRLSGLYRIAEFVGMMAQYKPDCVDKFDADEAIDVAGQSLVEHGVVRDDKDVEAIRAERAKQQQEMMKAEIQAKQAPALARAAKDLSQTPMGDGNALEATLAQGGGMA